MKASPAPKAKEPQENIFRPMVRVMDRDPERLGQPIKHPLELVYESNPDSLPEMKAVGYMRVSPLKNEWVSYTVTFKGKEVLYIQVGEPNLKQIAVDESKIAFYDEIDEKE